MIPKSLKTQLLGGILRELPEPLPWETPGGFADEPAPAGKGGNHIDET